VTTVVLGKGGFGEVRLARRLADGVKVGVKIISKVQFRGEEERRLMLLEAELHQRVSGHPNVTQLFEWLEDPGNFYMVMELSTGGELMERILSSHTFSERVAARYFRQMAQGLSHIHSKLVVHRDLKPENFLLADSSEDAQIKITDFGLSAVVASPDAVLTDPCGSAFYIAPEIFARSYTKAVDVWALGVILYLLLSGNVPFGSTAKSEPEVYAAIKAQSLCFGPDWNHLSGHARELVSGLLEKDPVKRYTLEQALSHPWVTGESAPDAPLALSLVESLRTFNAQNKFKKQALKLVASSLSAVDVAALRASFHKIDTDNTGAWRHAWRCTDALRPARSHSSRPLPPPPLSPLPGAQATCPTRRCRLRWRTWAWLVAQRSRAPSSRTLTRTATGRSRTRSS
jgi:calcium-dependent protein kinase